MADGRAEAREERRGGNVLKPAAHGSFTFPPLISSISARGRHAAYIGREAHFVKLLEAIVRIASS